MAKTKEKAKPKERKRNRVTGFLRDTVAELRKVRWPTREETWNLTKIVLAVTISMAILLGLLDWMFAAEVRGILDVDAVAIGIAAVVLVAGIVAGIVMNRRAA